MISFDSVKIAIHLTHQAGQFLLVRVETVTKGHEHILAVRVGAVVLVGSRDAVQQDRDRVARLGAKALLGPVLGALFQLFEFSEIRFGLEL